MVKTIKELSDEFGVTKQAVRKAIDRLAPTCYQRGANNTIEVDTEGYAILKGYYSNGNNQNKKNDGNLLSTENEKIISILQNELEISHKKNNNQQDQINQLQKLLENQQILTLKAQEKIQILELKKEDAEEKNTEDTLSKKWRFWK